MTDTINNGIPFVPENTIDPAAGLNLSLNTIDALLQVLVQTVGANTPPAGVEGQRHIVGTAPTGAWAGQANKLARFLDGAWQFFDARYALNAADGLWYVRSASSWAPLAGGGATLPVVQALSSTRNLGLADINTFNVNSTTNNYTATIPPQSSVTWTADAEIHFLPSNTGDITIAGGAGVSLNGAVAGSVTLSTAYGAASIKRTAADSWWVGGAIGTQAEQRAALGVPDAFGNRNRIINGNFSVNQLPVSGSVVLAAGAYGHDGWKAGASGCTYTFATSNNITTLTISAGSLQQVVEGLNLQSGTHALSWSGTAQGKIGGGSYSASGVTGSVTGGSNLTIEFNTGTLALVQLEPGSTATPFEHRSYGLELARCQRYYCTSSNTHDSTGWYGTTISGHTYRSYARFPVTMRTTPTVVVTHVAGGGFPTSGAVVAGLNGYSEERVASASGNNAWSTTYTASARL